MFDLSSLSNLGNIANDVQEFIARVDARINALEEKIQMSHDVLQRLENAIQELINGGAK